MKFNISHVGKIESAEIEIKPLTIFIGQNNSGKTYAASSLWAILNYIEENTSTLPNSKNALVSEETYQKYKNIFKEILVNFSIKETPYTVKIMKRELNELEKEINKNIIKRSSEILTKCFKYNDFKTSTLFISDSSKSALTFTFELEEHSSIDTDNVDNNFSDFEEVENSYTLNIKANKRTILRASSIPLKSIREGFSEIIPRHIIKFIIYYSYLGDMEKEFRETIYVPAARTGLMYGIHDIVQGSFELNNQFLINKRLSNEKLNDKLQLTAPLIDFISSINKKSSPMRRALLTSKTKPKRGSNSLKVMIDGDISLNNTSKNFEYTPKNNLLNIPLPATSSLITELAALNILEEDIREGALLFFEEPEAHLHLAAQRQLARFIVTLINKGCHMIITTHSDTFLQQLNNLLMLDKISKYNPAILSELEIEKDEIMSNDKVAVYDFYCDSSKTQVNRLDFGKYGFVADSLNEVIFKLATETQRINDEIDNLTIKE